MFCCKRRTWLVLLVSCGLAQAQTVEPDAEITRPWAVGIAAQADENSSSSGLLSFNWGVSPDTWLSFTAGNSRSPRDRADVSVKSLTAGLDHRFGWFGAAFELQRWGDPDALESSNYLLSLYAIGERFRVGFDHQERDSDIHFQTLGLLDRPIMRTVGMKSEGDGLRWRVEPAPQWQLYGSYMSYDHSRNLSLLPRIDALRLLNSSTLTLANGFIDEEMSFGVERTIRSSVLNVSYSQDRSAVDRSKLKSLNLAVMFPVSRRIDLELNIGTSRSELFDNDLYGGLLILLYGG